MVKLSPTKTKRTEGLNIKVEQRQAVHIKRDIPGLGDFVQILGAAQSLAKLRPDLDITLSGPDVIYKIGWNTPGIKVVKSRDSFPDEQELKMNNPCPAGKAEAKSRDRDRLEIFATALGVKPAIPKIHLSKTEIFKAEEFCTKSTGTKNPIVLVARSSAKWKDYAFSPELHRELKRRGVPVLTLDHEGKSPTPNTYGLTIRQQAAIINQASLVITPDTGWLHVAGALRKPIFGLFGAQDPVKRQAIYNVPGTWHQGFCPHGKMPCWYQRCKGKDEYQPCMETPVKVVADKIESVIDALGTSAKKLKFLHIPRTGGTSIRAAIDKTDGVEFTREPHQWTESEVKNHDCFTVIRHPVNRVVSAFYKIQRMREGDCPNRNSAWVHYLNALTLNEFFENYAAVSAVANNADDSMLYKQWLKIKDVDRLRIFRLEDGLQKGMDQLPCKLNLIDRKNVGPSNIDQLSRRALSVIEMVYRDDIALWNHCEHNQFLDGFNPDG